jgi:hypothetical protein
MASVALTIARRWPDDVVLKWITATCGATPSRNVWLLEVFPPWWGAYGTIFIRVDLFLS